MINKKIIKIGIIEPNGLEFDLIEQIKLNNNILISSCFSRNKGDEQVFIDTNKLKYIKILTNFYEAIEIVDAVIINSLAKNKYQDIKYFIQQQKHVIVNGIMCEDFNKLKELTELAKLNNVILIDTNALLHLPKYKILLKFVFKYKTIAAFFDLTQQNNKYLELIKENKLNSQQNINLLSYFLIYLAISLFGEVKSGKYLNQQLKNKITLSENIILKHTNDVIVNIVYSNVYKTLNKQKLVCQSTILEFDNPLNPTNIKIIKENDEINIIEKELEKNIYFYILSNFVNCIETNNYELVEKLQNITLLTLKTINLLTNI